MANVAWAYVNPHVGHRFKEYGRQLFSAAAGGMLHGLPAEPAYPAAVAKFLWAAAAVRWYDEAATG